MNCSTNDALLSIIENIQTHLDNSRYVAKVFADLKKAFETVDHDIFIKELQSNLCKMTTLGTTQKWSSWAEGHLIKHLYKTANNQMWSLLAGF